MLTRHGKYAVTYTAFEDDASVSTDGEWQDSADLDKLEAHVVVGTTGTVVVSGSNQPARPLDTEHGHALASLSSTGIFVITQRPRWYKVRITANTGLLSAWVHSKRLL